MLEVKQIEDGQYNIELTRGDYLCVHIGMVVDDVPYTPTSGSIKFVMKEKYGDEVPIALEKTVPLETMILELVGTDTKNLSMGKKYVYEIKYIKEDNEEDTFIQGTFKIGYEVD